jgi:hypothetical protein
VEVSRQPSGPCTGVPDTVRLAGGWAAEGGSGPGAGLAEETECTATTAITTAATAATVPLAVRRARRRRSRRRITGSSGGSASRTGRSSVSKPFLISSSRIGHSLVV